MATGEEAKKAAPAGVKFQVAIGCAPGAVVIKLGLPTAGLTLTPGEAEGMATQLKLMAQRARQEARKAAGKGKDVRWSVAGGEASDG